MKGELEQVFDGGEEGFSGESGLVLTADQMFRICPSHNAG